MSLKLKMALLLAAGLSDLGTKITPEAPPKNKYNLTDQEKACLELMSPKEKKKFLKRIGAK